jgi:hypothetical protein
MGCVNLLGAVHLSCPHTQTHPPLIAYSVRQKVLYKHPHLSKPKMALADSAVAALSGSKERGSGPLLSCRPRVTCWLAMYMLSASGLPIRQKSQVQGCLPVGVVVGHVDTMVSTLHGESPSDTAVGHQI